jgi:hypothetical protein
VAAAAAFPGEAAANVRQPAVVAARGGLVEVEKSSPRLAPRAPGQLGCDGEGRRGVLALGGTAALSKGVTSCSGVHVMSQDRRSTAATSVGALAGATSRRGLALALHVSD